MKRAYDKRKLALLHKFNIKSEAGQKHLSEPY